MSEGGVFLKKQLQSGITGIGFFGLVALSWLPWFAGNRYEFLLAGCLILQAALFSLGIESKRELAAIALFHAVGVGLEWYKVSRGSWVYPESSVTKLFGVPLFSGFMYAAVASYMIQAHRRFELVFVHWPKPLTVLLISLVIYGHYFGASALPGVRYGALALVGLCFWKTRVEFTTTCRRSMPMLAAFSLIGTAIYLCENLCTWIHVWEYPHQVDGWEPVAITKLSAWMLLSVVSLVIVRPFAEQGLASAQPALVSN